jgi:AAA domain-containing protein
MPTKDYAAIGAAKITQPSKRQNRAPRFLVYARNKKGKTRFGASAPDVLMLDPESGTDRETAINPQVWHANCWDDIEEFYGYMKWSSLQKIVPHKWATLDGFTKIHNIALTFIRGRAVEASLTRKPESVTTPDYGKAGELLKGFLHNMHALEGIGLVITSQERMIEVEGDDTESDPDEETSPYLFVPDLPKGTRAAVNAVVDIIGHLYTVKIPNNEGKDVIERRLWLAPSTKYDTGYRSEYVLPDFLRRPTVPRLEQLMRNGRILRPTAPTTETEGEKVNG